MIPLEHRKRVLAHQQREADRLNDLMEHERALLASGFSAEEYQHTARLLTSGNEATRRAALSNNFNIILSALSIAAAAQNERGAS